MNGYELYGLSSLRFSMDEPLKEKYLYRSLYGSLQMENGKIQSQQKEFANHIQVNFTMSENKYSLNFFGDILKAQVSLDAKGEFRIIPSSYSYVAYPYGDNRTVGITEKLRLFAGDHTANIKVRGDTRLLLESLSKKITSSYMEALWKGMQETGNQQLAYHTSFYRQFLLRPSVSLSVQVHSQEGFPLQANLLLQNGILQTEVKDLRQNQFKLYASFQNEMPFWQWSLQHKNGFSKWIQKAIPKELISQAKNIQLSYDAKTYGRRPVEWYQNQQGEGQIQMMDLKLGKSFLEKKVSPNWDTLEATFKRIAEKTWINPIRAENRYEVLTGYARIIEKYLNPEIFVSTYTIRKP
ncbi:MAG: hypothetical protein D6767_07440 [Candidatus Hydrogenedentota bacterium]|nr:MAG: hypothetical protein D6767_07440 [Candidatus Hydrogenedentota bacterium]